MIAKLFLLALCALGVASAQRTCQSVDVPACQVRVARDLLFLVDASDSLNPARFQDEMLNYVQSLFCAFNQQDVNRAGMVTFNKDIKERIPLAKYSTNEWFSRVEDIRGQNLCCSCCTPTAEAFATARRIFEAVPIGNAYRIVFTITDGNPWQNTAGEFAWPGIAAAKYTWGVVPEQAQLLKDMFPADPLRMRLMMVGVPNKQGEPPLEGYFRGVPDKALVPAGKPNTWQCIRRDGQTCYNMAKSPFPIISEPLNKNVFTSRTYNVQSLIDLTVGSLCEVSPTVAPTGVPTTLAPTRPPTLAPTNGPTKPPTFAPSRAPTMSPIKPELDGLDMYLLLDRSRSMRWVPDLCRSAPGGNPTDNDAVACWKLFLTFVRSLVVKTTQLPYKTTTLGWKADNAANIKRGVRVWMYGFACSDHQSTPVVVHIGEKLESLAAFDAALKSAEEMIPIGGTCPGAAIERSVAMIQGNDLLTRIYKTAILITDGVSYDGTRPMAAAKGLFHFGVLTYSLGIAIPDESGQFGLTRAEIARQKVQLMSFIQGDETRLFNFGLDGLNLLDTIAQKMVNQLPYDAVEHFPTVMNRPFWCGWTSIDRCTSTDDANTNTGKYCQWNTQMKKCLAKDWCRYTSRVQCSKDNFCLWKNKKCGAKKQMVLG